MEKLPMPLVSIIIPVYNVERLLSRCLDSILSQTFTNYEVILIDDGSMDLSGKICDIYASKDDRFKVLHQVNQGVSKAREVGVKMSSGGYIIHVDPDDWIEKNMLEILYLKALSENSDIIICDFYVNNGKYEKRKSQSPLSLNPDEVLLELFYRLSGTLCNKLVKRRLYDGVLFSNGISCGEDYLICMRILKNATKISYISEAFYHYDITSNMQSLTKRKDPKIFKSDEEVILRIYKEEILQNQHIKEYNSQVCAFAWAAFIKKIFDSKEYRNQYRNKKALLNNKMPLPIRCFTYLSACGLYSWCQRFYKMLLKMRNNK